MKSLLSIQIFLISLATLVLFNGMGFYMVAFAKTGIHRELVNITGNSTSHLLKLNKDEFEKISWIGKNDFIFHDAVYDCKSIQSLNGKILMRCIIDNEETNIKNTVAESFGENPANSSQQKSVKEVFKFFPVFPIRKTNILLQSSIANKIEFGVMAISSFHSPDFEIASPPPEIA
ncbi:hypothetical protein BH09BAC5_BH09BAC5_09900 [soil metagenome]